MIMMMMMMIMLMIVDKWTGNTTLLEQKRY